MCMENCAESGSTMSSAHSTAREERQADRELDLTQAVEHDVGRLEIVVDYASGSLIEVRQAGADLRYHHPRLLLWQGLCPSKPHQELVHDYGLEE